MLLPREFVEVLAGPGTIGSARLALFKPRAWVYRDGTEGAMVLMPARSDQYAANAERTPATFAPTAGLGAALAGLPPPWTVFRQGGISPFDTGGGEIYGGLY